MLGPKLLNSEGNLNYPIFESLERSIHLAAAGPEPLKAWALASRKLSADVLRLDRIHPVISGNKWFKLKNYLSLAFQEKRRRVISFGGAWSNHLLALAYAAQRTGLNSLAFVRGERPKTLSLTLEAAAGFGMEFHFLSGEAYRHLRDPAILQSLENQYPDACLIPEGGAGFLGVSGCQEILNLTDKENYSHIFCALGTGTMLRGLLLSAGKDQRVTGISILNDPVSAEKFRVPGLSPDANLPQADLQHAYHFGGYARKSPALIRFMNEFYAESGVATDFVYTGKLFYGLMDLATRNYFLPGSKILVIHSGGLQGNRSLPTGTLTF
jgi:1-aminocyclopropane-1-carboxylate deaminase